METPASPAFANSGFNIQRSMPNRVRVEPRSTLINRNIIVSGHRTSIRLEPEMWGALLDISAREGKSVHDLCTMVADRKKVECSLTAAIRVFTMAYYKAAATEDGHQRAGHGQR